MQIKLIQTADADCYKVMFDITSRASRQFCALQGIEFEPYIGVKRGYFPWHATFNRIGLLHDLLVAGYRGWAIYLDADAYPFDMTFDLPGYLAENQQWGMIAASGGHAAYMPNNGILLFNFANPAAREVVAQFQAAFLREQPDEKLRKATDWAAGGDQLLLHPLLYYRGDYDQLVKIEGFDLIGWPGSRLFRQHLKQFGSFRERCEQALAGVNEALALSHAPG